MKYNLSEIMKRAWNQFRKENGNLTFGECLHRSWLSAKAEPINAKIIEDAKAENGITEEVNTWYGWKRLGYEVIHESKCLFQTLLIHGSKGDNAWYKASFFGASQVALIA